MEVSAGVVYELEVAPEMFAQVELSAEDCHCKVQVPVPPAGVAASVAVPLVQTVVPPEVVTEGSATTSMMTSLDAGQTCPRASGSPAVVSSVNVSKNWYSLPIKVACMNFVC